MVGVRTAYSHNARKKIEQKQKQKLKQHVGQRNNCSKSKSWSPPDTRMSELGYWEKRIKYPI